MPRASDSLTLCSFRPNDEEKEMIRRFMEENGQNVAGLTREAVLRYVSGGDPEPVMTKLVEALNDVRLVTKRMRSVMDAAREKEANGA